MSILHAASEAASSPKTRLSRRRTQILIVRCFLLLLCLGLPACADRSPAIALGVGTHGAGVALFTDSAWMGFGSHGGVMVGFGSGDYSDGRTYSSGRIVRREPAGASPARPADWNWRRGYEFPSLLAAYRKVH